MVPAGAVRAVDLTAKGRQEESVRSGIGSVAQGIERPPPKRQVDGSNPSGVTMQKSAPGTQTRVTLSDVASPKARSFIRIASRFRPDGHSQRAHSVAARVVFDFCQPEVLHQRRDIHAEAAAQALFQTVPAAHRIVG